MIRNFDIAELLLIIGDYLKTNSAVVAFCTENFAKNPTVQAGEVLAKSVPTEENAPYIIVYGGKKTEGLNQNPCVYSASIFVGVATASDTMVVNGVNGSVMYDGYDLTSRFLTVIQDALNSRRPMASVESEVFGSSTPDGTHWGGNMNCSWEIEQTLGMSAQEEF